MTKLIWKVGIFIISFKFIGTRSLKRTTKSRSRKTTKSYFANILLQEVRRTLKQFSHIFLYDYATCKKGQVENSLGNFSPRFFNPSFRFWPTAKIKNSKKRKLGIIFVRFLRFPAFPSFRVATFSFSFLIFFSFFINVFFFNLLFTFAIRVLHFILQIRFNYHINET